MNVLLTHERFLPDFGGGGEYIAFETARHLMRRGVHVRVLTTGDPAATNYEGVPTVRLPLHRYGLNLAVRRIVREARTADLIHTCNYHAALPSLLAGRWLRKPVVCQMLGLFDEGWKEMRGPVLGRAFMRWERFILKRDFARTMFLSDYSLEVGVAHGVDRRAAVANCPGVALAECQAASQRHEKDNVVLFAGKLERRKGVDDLLAVARRLPGVRFRVAGWGPEAGRFLSEAPPNVEFVGFQQGERLRATFARAPIFFFPSRAETFGLVIVEAMASGCAIVSTIPIPFEGVRVEVGDRDAMTAAIRKLWEERGATALMGQRNADLAAAYTWERYTDSLVTTYTEVLRERTAGSLLARASAGQAATGGAE